MLLNPSDADDDYHTSRTRLLKPAHSDDELSDCDPAPDPSDLVVPFRHKAPTYVRHCALLVGLVCLTGFFCVAIFLARLLGGPISLNLPEVTDIVARGFTTSVSNGTVSHGFQYYKVKFNTDSTAEVVTVEVVGLVNVLLRVGQLPTVNTCDARSQATPDSREVIRTLRSGVMCHGRGLYLYLAFSAASFGGAPPPAAGVPYSFSVQRVHGKACNELSFVVLLGLLAVLLFLSTLVFCGYFWLATCWTCCCADLGAPQWMALSSHVESEPLEAEVEVEEKYAHMSRKTGRRIHSAVAS